MRQNKDFDWIYCVIFPIAILIFIIEMVIFGLSYFGNPVREKLVEMSNEQIDPLSNTELYEIYENVYVDEELDAETEALYQKILSVYLNELPLYQYDYRIILTNEDLSGNVPEYAQGHDIVAITNSTHKIIKLKYEKFEYSILHEIGHAVDRYEDYSQTEEFQALYNNIEHDTYYTCDAREYFAYCYSFYVVGSLSKPAEKAYFDRLVYGYSFTIGG